MGFKKRGFGQSKWNGFGGKLEQGETPEKATVREVLEECCVFVSERDLVKNGEHLFIFPFKPEWNMLVHVFIAKKWSGDPSETEEIRSQWFELSAIPYPKMWDATNSPSSCTHAQKSGISGTQKNQFLLNSKSLL